jgi:hypothetical protein
VDGLFKYTHADGETLTGSDVTLHFSDSSDFVIPLISRFSDYDAYGGELGARYFICSPESRIRPYVSVNAGAVYVGCISLHTWTNVLGEPFDVIHDTFYDDSIVGTASAVFGLESRVTRSFSVGAEVGLRYETPLCGTDLFSSDSLTSGGSIIGLGSLSGLNNLNDAGDRLVIPVSFFAKVRF